MINKKFRPFFIKVVLKKKTAGKEKIVIAIKLKACKPITFTLCIISKAQEVLYAQRFQGKPVNNFALKKSDNANVPEKKNKDTKFNFKYGATNKIVSATNKLKNNGINISANGMKILKLSSNVRELVIQDKPDK